MPHKLRRVAVYDVAVKDPRYGSGLRHFLSKREALRAAQEIVGALPTATVYVVHATYTHIWGHEGRRRPRRAVAKRR